MTEPYFICMIENSDIHFLGLMGSLNKIHYREPSEFPLSGLYETDFLLCKMHILNLGQK